MIAIERSEGNYSNIFKLNKINLLEWALTNNLRIYQCNKDFYYEIPELKKEIIALYSFKKLTLLQHKKIVWNLNSAKYNKLFSKLNGDSRIFMPLETPDVLFSRLLGLNFITNISYE